MTITNGIVTNPFTKVRVPWILAPCLIPEALVFEALGITVYSIGNPDHLDNVPAGGHTPWRAGSVKGIVWAIDVMVDTKGWADDLERWLRDVYLPSDADTSWIKFLNVNGSQYDYTGKRLQSSGDHHLHLEVRDGKQNTSTGLASAWRIYRTPKPPPPPKPSVPTVSGEVTMRIIRKANDKAYWKTDGFGREHISTMAAVTTLEGVFGKTLVVDSLEPFGPEVISIPGGQTLE